MDRPALPVDLAGFALCSWIPGTVMLLVKIFGRDGAQRGRPVEYGSALATILTIVQAFLLYFAIVNGWGLDTDMSHSGEISRAHTVSVHGTTRSPVHVLNDRSSPSSASPSSSSRKDASESPTCLWYTSSDTTTAPHSADTCGCWAFSTYSGPVARVWPSF
ncbi:hypothetical protein LTR33_007430 [Friedmanniomyces endolithicus]|nr:hypothetical protein LTR33_007430 [Friedmanniomyces endolithicus]